MWNRTGRWAVAAIVVATAVAVAPGPIARVRDYVSTSFAMDVRAPHDGTPFSAWAPSDPPVVRIAAAGDVGTGDRAEQETADAMAALPGAPFDALLLLGDNVYPSGDPTRLPDTVFNPFRDVLRPGTALLGVLGNHDVSDGNARGQVHALGMPGRWYSWRSGPVEVFALDSTVPGNAEQLIWLRTALAQSTARWKIAALHHPPYSAGWHGSARGVRAAFEPLFDRYGVQLVLAGHDHDYQRSVPIDGVTYVVSGAGAKTRPTDRAAFTAVSWSTRHFLDIEVWGDRIEVQAVAHDGLVYDRFVLREPPSSDKETTR